MTTAVLFATGDITAQQLVEKRGIQKHDLTRTGRMALYGGCKKPAPCLFLSLLLIITFFLTYHTHFADLSSLGVFGPAATTWLGFLARRVNFKGPRITTLARVACDQTLFAPIAIGAFLSSMAVMEGNSPTERLETTWWPALKANWMVWPFVQFINFTFLPLQYRLLFANVISIGWNSYLSWVNGQSKKVLVEK